MKKNELYAFKQAYNNHLYEGNKPIPGRQLVVELSIHLPEHSFHLGRISALERHMLRDLIDSFVQHTLAQPADSPVELPPEPQPVAKKELEAIAHVTYKGTQYLVQHLRENDENVYIVVRDSEPDKGKVLDQSSPHTKGVVKKYLKEKEKGKEELPG